MVSRRFLTVVGASALGLGVVFGGPALPVAFAQETTPAVEAPAQTEPAGDPAAWRAQAYDGFVSSLASELNVDDADVDAAIRTVLKQQVDELEASGKLDADLASELQTMIDEAEAPLMLGMGGPGGFPGRGEMHGFLGRGGEHGGPRGSFHDRDQKGELREEPEDDEAPASLPSADDAADQNVPIDAPAAESTILN